MDGSDSKGSKHIWVWGVCATALGVFLFTLVAISHLHGAQSERDQQHANQSRERSHGSLRGLCANVPPNRAAECAYEAIKTDHEEYRAEENLRAQRTMATWTFATTMIGLMAVALSLGGLIALLRDLRQNRDSAERQLRAYLHIEPSGVNEAKEGLCRVPLQIFNAGQTPAYDLELFGDFLVVSGEPLEFDPATHGRYSGEVISSDQMLGKDQSRWINAYFEEEMVEPFLEAIRDKKTAIVHYGFLRYSDTFGARHETHFAFYHWGEELSDAETRRCRHGNHAT